MFCRRYKIKMWEMAHSAHKKRKLVCPSCGGARMMGGKEKARDRRRKDTLSFYYLIGHTQSLVFGSGAG